MIITSPLNAPDTLLLLDQLTAYNHSKILIIDIIGSIFNKQNDFYKSITRNKDKWLTNNLLVLTTLTDKLKRFLNATFTTEYKNIYGKNEAAQTTRTTRTTATTAKSLSSPSRTTATTTGTTTTAAASIVDQNTDHHHERNVLRLLTDSMGNRRNHVDGIVADGNTADANFINSFNEIQLRAVLNLFRAKFFNENCARHRDSSDRAQNKQSVSDGDGDGDGDVTANQTKRIEPCARNANSLMKCESYLRTAMKMATMNALVANATVLCEQIAKHVHKVNADDRNKRNAVNWNVNGSVGVMQELIHLIPNHNDTKFSEYFTFFDFVVAKLAKTNKLRVNYGRSGNGAGAVGGGASRTTATGVEVFDFCVLDFHVSRFTVNQTTATTAFVWRPFLILRQSEINQNLYITHPLIVGYHNWFFDGTSQFWTCGLLCWILAGIVIMLLICILIAGVTIGLAIR